MINTGQNTLAISMLLADSGISDYSVYLDEETHALIATHKLTGERSAADLSTSPLVRLSACPVMAGIYGRHHQDKPGQLAAVHSPGGNLPFALNNIAIARIGGADILGRVFLPRT